jgi:hypothetical protein
MYRSCLREPLHHCLDKLSGLRKRVAILRSFSSADRRLESGQTSAMSDDPGSRAGRRMDVGGRSRQVNRARLQGGGGVAGCELGFRRKRPCPRGPHVDQSSNWIAILAAQLYGGPTASGAVGPPLTLKCQSCGLWSARPELTTKPDHNRVRHEPILADTPWPQAQVSDGIRQSARILQAGGQSGSPSTEWAGSVSPCAKAEQATPCADRSYVRWACAARRLRSWICSACLTSA